MEETISRMAGSEHGSAKTVAELVEIGAGIGRPVRERTTMYGADAADPPGRPAGQRQDTATAAGDPGRPSRSPRRAAARRR